MTEIDGKGDWRERKKAATRDRLRDCALQLFLEHGYDATTVEQIAAAAGVSHMTFFRYFPTKEDVALADGYDPLIVELLGRTDPTKPLMDRIGVALLEGLRQIYDADRETMFRQMKLIVSTPVLRDRLWANQMATQQRILDSLDIGGQHHRPSFETRVAVAASLAAASTAVITWVESDGKPELPELIDDAFDALGRSHRTPLRRSTRRTRTNDPEVTGRSSV
jgi:AcrR family transcriptional regulator